MMCDSGSFLRCVQVYLREGRLFLFKGSLGKGEWQIWRDRGGAEWIALGFCAWLRGLWGVANALWGICLLLLRGLGAGKVAWTDSRY